MSDLPAPVNSRDETSPSTRPKPAQPDPSASSTFDFAKSARPSSETIEQPLEEEEDAQAGAEVDGSATEGAGDDTPSAEKLKEQDQARAKAKDEHTQKQELQPGTRAGSDHVDENLSKNPSITPIPTSTFPLQDPGRRRKNREDEERKRMQLLGRPVKAGEAVQKAPSTTRTHGEWQSSVVTEKADEIIDGRETVSQVEQLLTATRDILNILASETSRRTNQVDLEYGASQNVSLSKEDSAYLLRSFLRIKERWNLNNPPLPYLSVVSNTTLEWMVAEADRQSNTLDRFCDKVKSHAGVLPITNEQMVWLVKRLVMLRFTTRGKFSVPDENTLLKTALSIQSWLLALLEALDHHASPEDDVTVDDFVPLIVALARYSTLMDLQLGHVILHGSKEGLFEIPEPFKQLDHSTCKQLFLCIAKAESVLNFTSEVYEVESGMIEHVMDLLSVEEVLAIPVHRLSPLWIEIVGKPRYPLNALEQELRGPAAQSTGANNQAIRAFNALIKGEDFVSEDLNIKMLKSVGELTIQWTKYYDQHLYLEKSSKTLFVCWFAAPPCTLPYDLVEDRLSEWYREGCRINLAPDRRKHPLTFHPNVSNLLNREILSTWTLLFQSGNEKEELEKLYEEIEAPPWLQRAALSSRWERTHVQKRKLKVGGLRSLASKKRRKTMAVLVHADSRKDYPIIDSHIGKADWAKYEEYQYIASAPRLNYSEFPIFENRLRTLRAYMDTAKPRGLLQLWRDNRDSLTYYTFWGVIVFGVGSLFVAFLSLAVSIAQTVASFKSLHLSGS